VTPGRAFSRRQRPAPGMYVSMTHSTRPTLVTLSTLVLLAPLGCASNVELAARRQPAENDAGHSQVAASSGGASDAATGAGGASPGAGGTGGTTSVDPSGATVAGLTCGGGCTAFEFHPDSAGLIVENGNPREVCSSFHFPNTFAGTGTDVSPILPVPGLVQHMDLFRLLPDDAGADQTGECLALPAASVPGTQVWNWSSTDPGNRGVQPFPVAPGDRFFLRAYYDNPSPDPAPVSAGVAVCVCTQ